MGLRRKLRYQVLGRCEVNIKNRQVLRSVCFNYKEELYFSMYQMLCGWRSVSVSVQSFTNHYPRAVSATKRRAPGRIFCHTRKIKILNGTLKSQNGVVVQS